MLSQFVDMVSLANLFDLAVFLLSSLGTGLSFMSMSLLFLEL